MSTRSKIFAQGTCILAIAVLATGCSASTDLELSESLTVAMMGVFETPSDAIGNSEPKALTFELQGVALTAADGTTVDLFEGAEPTEYVIINRSQIIFEADLADHVDTVFTAITVTFGADITGKGKYEDAMPTTLTVAQAIYANAFTVETAKAVTLDVDVQWRNIVTRDDDAETETMSSPSFVASLDDG